MKTLGVIALLAVGLTATASAAPFRAGSLEPPRPAPDFTLKTADGDDFRLGRHRGDVVVIAFGYTFCPDVCPTTLAELAQVKAKLGPRARYLRVAFVTVDPERDVPERLRTYTRAFDPAFVGLTGTAAELAQVRRAYGVTAERRVVPGTAAAYLIDHSAFLYVVDPQGLLRLMIPFGTPVDDMTHDIQLLLPR
jgi:protein SCO1/2